MPGFYTTVLILAVLLLIVCLIIFGIMMKRSNKQLPFPPYADQCPVQWKPTTTGGCLVPNATNPNLGLFRPQFLNAANMDWPYYYQTYLTATPSKNNVTDVLQDFSNNLATRATTGVALKFNDNVSLCDKYAWAKKFNVVWDGISNYNQC